MRQMYIFATIVAAFASHFVFAEDPVVNFVYESTTGGLGFESTKPIRLMHIYSRSRQFNDTALSGILDQNDFHVSILTRPDTELDSFDYGMLMPTGLTHSQLVADFCVEAYGYVNGVQTGYAPVHVNGESLNETFANCDVSFPAGPPPTDPFAIVHYDSLDGNVRVEVGQANGSPSAAELATFELLSRSHLFTNEPAMHVDGIFDVDSDGKIFKLFPSGFESVDFGRVMEPGLSNSQIVGDLCIEGAWLHGGFVLGEYQYPDAGTVPISCSKNAAKPTDLAVEYDVGSGNLIVDVDELIDPLGAEKDRVSTLEIRSESGIFTGTLALHLDGPNDSFTRFRLLKQDRNGFTRVNFGPIIRPGVALDFLTEDLTFDATLTDGSVLGEIRHTVVAEPHGSVLAAIVGVFLIGPTRRRIDRHTNRRGD